MEDKPAAMVSSVLSTVAARTLFWPAERRTVLDCLDMESNVAWMSSWRFSWILPSVGQTFLRMVALQTLGGGAARSASYSAVLSPLSLLHVVSIAESARAVPRFKGLAHAAEVMLLNGDPVRLTLVASSHFVSSFGYSWLNMKFYEYLTKQNGGGPTPWYLSILGGMGAMACTTFFMYPLNVIQARIENTEGPFALSELNLTLSERFNGVGWALGFGVLSSLVRFVLYDAMKSRLVKRPRSQ